MYEAFFDVYVGDAVLNLQEEGQADHFEIILKKGKSSGHLNLVARLKYTEVEVSLCLFNSNMLKDGRQSCFSAALMMPPNEFKQGSLDTFKALAYVVSLEKLIGMEDVVLIRISSIQRRFAEDMDKFRWMPDQIPNLESTSYVSDVIYLVRKVGSPE